MTEIYFADTSCVWRLVVWCCSLLSLFISCGGCVYGFGGSHGVGEERRVSGVDAVEVLIVVAVVAVAAVAIAVAAVVAVAAVAIAVVAVVGVVQQHRHSLAVLVIILLLLCCCGGELSYT